MRSIGIRVTPKIIYYTIATIEKDGFSIGEEGVESIIVPKSMDVPQKLTYIRQTLFSIINEFNVTSAGIRITEYNARRSNADRLNIEGVVQELLANSTVLDYMLGTINVLSKFTGINNKELSESLKEGTPIEDYEISGWQSMKKEERESLITALAALSLEKEGE